MKYRQKSTVTLASRNEPNSSPRLTPLAGREFFPSFWPYAQKPGLARANNTPYEEGGTTTIKAPVCWWAGSGTHTQQ